MGWHAKDYMRARSQPEDHIHSK